MTAWRRPLTLLVCFVGLVSLVLAQTAPATGTFLLYVNGREAGRETDTRTLTDGARKLESTVELDGATLSGALEAAFDWSPRRLTIRGGPLLGESVDVDVTVAGGRALVRDGDRTESFPSAASPFYPAAGALPVSLQEELIAYWRNHGRPAEIRSAPAGPIRITSKAEQQIELNGRVIRVERLAIDGPVWGRQTGWAEPSGRLDALITWIGTTPVSALRQGFETRLDQFQEQALRDRMDDLDRMSALALPEEPAGFVLTGATVIASAGRSPVEGATVVVRDGRIAAVGPASRVKPPAGLPVRDVSGMTIVPGLWDLDARMSQVELAPLYLAAGITSIRQTTPDQAFAAAYRESVASSQDRVPGPRVISAAYIAGAEGEDDGRQALRRARSEGARYVEIGPLVPLGVARAIASEGRRLALGVGAHMPEEFSFVDAGELAADLIEGLPGRGPQASDLTTALAAWAKSKTTYAPQLAWSDLVRNGGPAAWWQPGALPLPPSLAHRFVRLAAGAAATSNSPGAQTLVDPRSIVSAAREAGVTLTVGTGAGIPGSGLYRELELLVEAGLTPAQALAAATSTPADLMRMGDSGAIESGKRADLIVLGANPLDRISNIRAIKWVVANGKLYDPARLWRAAGFEPR